MPKNGILEHAEGLETAVEGIYVIGDAAGPPYYAHKAIAQGIVAVDHLMGKQDRQAFPVHVPLFMGKPRGGGSRFDRR